MEISAMAAMATSLQAQKVQEAVGMGVLKMQMDNAKSQGQALVDMLTASAQLMEKSVTPHLGANIDILA